MNQVGKVFFSPSPLWWGGGTLVLGFETSLNSHFIISLNPLKGEAHVGAHVFKGLEACLFNTAHKPGMAGDGWKWLGMTGNSWNDQEWPGMAGNVRG